MAGSTAIVVIIKDGKIFCVSRLKVLFHIYTRNFSLCYYICVANTSPVPFYSYTLLKLIALHRNGGKKFSYTLLKILI